METKRKKHHYFRNGRHVEVYSRVFIPIGSKPSFYAGSTITVYEGTIRGFDAVPYYRPSSRVVDCNSGEHVEHCGVNNMWWVTPETKLTREQVIEHFRNNPFN